MHVEFADGQSRVEFRTCTREEAVRDPEACYCHGCGQYYSRLSLLAEYDDEGNCVEHFRGCPECMTDEYLVDMNGEE